jgi:aspartate/methionine/tyrosine aminotransferase
MVDHEGTGKHDLSESCCASMSIKELQALSPDSSALPISLDEIQGYGPVRGSEKLRTNVAALYSGGNLSAKDVLITPGSIQANFLIMYALISPGDHVICHYPTFQQLYAVPESLGASVTFWRAREDKRWSLDVDELEKMITPKTKLIVIK